MFRVLNPGHARNTLSHTSFKSSSNQRPFGVPLRSAAKSGKKREKKRETDQKNASLLANSSLLLLFSLFYYKVHC